MVAHLRRPGQDGAGDDDSDSGQREDPVDRKAETGLRRTVADRRGGRDEAGAKLVNAISSQRRHRQDLDALQRRSGGRRPDFRGDLGAAVGRREIGFRHDRKAASDAKQIEDRQMLQRLRLDPVIGRDHEQSEINSARARQHSVHEALMTGHIDEAKNGAGHDRQIGEAEIDGHTPRLFLLQPVAVDSGQRFDQGGLAMVDVTCGSDDHDAASRSFWRAWRSAVAISVGDSAARTTVR